MKINDEITYQMLKVVRSYMNSKKAIWQSNQFIVDCMAVLDTNISLIFDATVNSKKSTKGITKSKKLLRAKLTILVFMIKESLRLYYQINNQDEKMQLLMFKISKLKLLKENDFYVMATHISETAISLSTLLFPLGITQQMIDDLRDGLIEFNTMTPQKDLVKQTGKSIVKFIPAKVNETRLMVINSLDSIINTFMVSNQEFVSGYKKARKRIKKPGNHKYYSVLISGKLSDIETSVAQTDVIIVAGKKKKTTISDLKGMFKIRVYIKDADTITFSREGLVTLNIDIPKKIIKNEIKINASLVKKPAITNFNDMNLHS